MDVKTRNNAQEVCILETTAGSATTRRERVWWWTDTGRWSDFVSQPRTATQLLLTYCASARCRASCLSHAKPAEALGDDAVAASDLRLFRHFVSYRLLSLLTERVSVELGLV